MASKRVKKKPKPKPRKKAAPKTKAKPRKKAAPKTKARAKVKPKTRPKVKPKARAKVKPKTRPKVKRPSPAKRAQRQRRIIAAIRRTPEGRRYRVMQDGPVLIERKGYYITINALVPGEWATSSTPVFEQAPTDEFHQIVWRTPVRQTIQQCLADYDQLLIDQSVYGDVQEMQFAIISGELCMLHEDHTSYTIRNWAGQTVPRWLRRTAKKLSKQ